MSHPCALASLTICPCSARESLGRSVVKKKSISSILLPIGLRECSIWRTVQPEKLRDWQSPQTRRQSSTHNWMR